MRCVGGKGRDEQQIRSSNVEQRERGGNGGSSMTCGREKGARTYKLMPLVDEGGRVENGNGTDTNRCPVDKTIRKGTRSDYLLHCGIHGRKSEHFGGTELTD